MAGGGFSIAITATDGASKTIDGLNKRLATLSAPAERFNKALAKFGDVSGLNRVTESVRGLGAGAADAFRSLDRMASPLAAITSVGSIAGMAALTRKWAEFGNQVGQTSYRLNMPAEKLGNLRGAMRLAGGSAADLDSGMRGLDERLRGAAFGRDTGAIQLFKSLGVSFGDAEHGARTANDALGDIAESIKGKTPGAQSRILEGLGLGDSFLPLLKNGRAGLEEFQKKAEATGSSMTEKMTADATKMNEAWQRLGLDFEGVGNRIADSWSGTVTKVLENSSKWIENNKKLTDNIASIGAGILALGALKPAAWVMRLLGLGAFVDVIPPAAVAGAAAAATYANGQASASAQDIAASQGYTEVISTDDSGMATEYRNPKTGLSKSWMQFDPRYNPALRPPPASPSTEPDAPLTVPLGGGAPGSNPRDPRGLRNNNPLNLSYLPGQGAIGSDGRFGIYKTMEDGIAAEARQFARYTETGSDTLRKIINRWAPPSDNDTPTYLNNVTRSLGIDPDQQVDMHDPMLSSRLIQTMSKLENGRAVPMDVIQNGVAQATENGHVKVDVHLHGAPAGTTARATSSGPVTVAPPRIATSMPY